MQPDEASYFVNIAVIGGTLLGLTFAILSFFLVDMLKRFEGRALPVFRSRDSGNSEQPSQHFGLPDSLNDHQLFDGDPLVIFIAYSVAVTWILFLFPLTIGLTAAWVGRRLDVLGIELASLVAFFALSFVQRNQAMNKLRPYLTREERFWPALGGLLLVVYLLSSAVVLTSAFSGAPHLAFWNADTGNLDLSIAVLKVICITSLLVGTYTTNKDMFVFFKSIASERMRQKWLEWFIAHEYQKLSSRVHAALERVPTRQREDLREQWRGGCPKIISTHDAFSNTQEKSLETIWQEIVRGRGDAPSWMLDVPSIAEWAAQTDAMVSRFMQGYAGAGH